MKKIITAVLLCFSIVVVAKPIPIISNVQITAKNNHLIVGMRLENSPWNPAYQSNAYLICGKGVIPAGTDGLPEHDKIYTKAFWKSLKKWQQRWMEKNGFIASHNAIETPNVKIQCFDNKIMVSAKSYDSNLSNFRTLINTLSHITYDDFPFIQSTPSIVPQFFPKDKVPKSLTPAFYNNTFNSISFALAKNAKAQYLRISLDKDHIYAFQTSCAMHCAPTETLDPNVKVKVLQNKHSDWAMQDGKSQPVKYDSAKSVTIDIYTNNANNHLPWQVLDINYNKGRLIYWRSKNMHHH